LSFNKPAWFDQVGREVAFAHQHAAIFDQSSFGKIRVRGADAETFLNRVCSNDMTRPTGRAIYTAMLNERGGYESDLTAVRLGDNEYRLYVGTSAIRRDLAWLRRHLLPGEQVDINDQTEEFAILGLMGPDAAAIATRLGAEELNHLGFFCCGEAQIAGIPVHAVRLSYVGEAGWELCCKVNNAESLFDALIAAGAQPAGIFAQSSMRIEKRFLAFGHDLDTDLNPIQAGLGFTLDWSSEFIGKSALLPIRHQTPASLLVSIQFDDVDAQPLGNEPVYHQGRIVGKTTSASFGYRVGKPIAIALIENQSKLDGLKVDVDIAGSQNAGTIHTAATWNSIG
jgi:4-methylaminobutanoate oxidase (formaldehyde-forming)